MPTQISILLSAIAALGAVLGLIWLAARLAQASGLAARATGQGRLTIETSLALDGKRRLYLVRCDQKRLLILASPARDAVVGWLPDEIDPAP